jgi:hypothetical protein
MKKGIILAAVMVSMLMYVLPSCYKNKEDILVLPTVSFRSEVVPIVVAGGCGCHNNGQGNTAVQFSHADTIFYDAILGRAGVFSKWVNGGTHPGGGDIDFKANDKITVQNWLKEGSKDDGGGCVVTGTVTYTKDIAPIYTTSCKGATCHGGLGPVLDYNKMVADKAMLTAMMASSGNSGHPGGALSLSTCTVKTFDAWIAQGQPK